MFTYAFQIVPGSWMEKLLAHVIVKTFPHFVFRKEREIYVSSTTTSNELFMNDHSIQSLLLIRYITVIDILQQSIFKAVETDATFQFGIQFFKKFYSIHTKIDLIMYSKIFLISYRLISLILVFKLKFKFLRKNKLRANEE